MGDGGGGFCGGAGEQHQEGHDGRLLFVRQVGFARLENEQDEHRDDEAEKAREFRQREGEEKRLLVASRSRGVAESARKKVAEDDAEADAGASERQGGDASADQFCSFCFHFKLPVSDEPLILLRRDRPRKAATGMM